MNSLLRRAVGIWTGYSEKSRKLFEERLVYNWGNVDPEKVKISNIPITDIEDDTIHSIEIKSGNKPVFVLIPAYGASGALYYKLMKPLSDKFDVYLVDMRGMGW